MSFPSSPNCRRHPSTGESSVQAWDCSRFLPGKREYSGKIPILGLPVTLSVMFMQ